MLQGTKFYLHAGTAWASMTDLCWITQKQWLTSAQTLNSHHNRYQYVILILVFADTPVYIFN